MLLIADLDYLLTIPVSYSRHLIQTVNPSKSNVVVISPKSMHDITEHLIKNYGSSQNHTGKSVKYLRGIIDNKLNFYEQIKVLE